MKNKNIKASSNDTYDTADMIQCRASSGVSLSASEPWEPNKPVSYIYAPAGLHKISAGFRKNETISIAVMVDEQTATDLQSSFDHITATEKQEPFADEDHESRKATLRYPAGQVKFVYGTHDGEDGVIVQGAEPTSYGAEVVNGKVYRSWSPEFATDADYTKAKCKKGHWTFPDGVRGSEGNPARMIAVNFVTGALTNKPAFKAMPKVKAKAAEEGDAGEEHAATTHEGTVEHGATGYKGTVVITANEDRCRVITNADGEEATVVKAADPVAVVKAQLEVTAEDTDALDKIFARHELQTFGVDALAARVPMAETRKAMDAIYARQLGEPVPVKIVKAKAKVEPEAKATKATDASAATLETLYARCAGAKP